MFGTFSWHILVDRLIPWTPLRVDRGILPGNPLKVQLLAWVSQRVAKFSFRSLSPSQTPDPTVCSLPMARRKDSALEDYWDPWESVFAKKPMGLWLLTTSPIIPWFLGSDHFMTRWLRFQIVWEFSPRTLGKMKPFWLILFKGVGSTTNEFSLNPPWPTKKLGRPDLWNRP